MNIVRRLLLLAPVALVITACNSTEPNAMQRISVSAAIASAGVRPSPGISADLIVTGAGGSVKISSAEMVLSRLKLATDAPCAGDSSDVEAPDSIEHSAVHDSADGDHEDSTAHDSSDVDHEDSTAHDTSDVDHEHDHGDQGEGHDEDGCAPIKTGPALVNPPLDGTTKIVLDALVPAGTYTRLQAKLDDVDSGGNGASDFLAAHPELAGLSVKVVGVFTDSGGADHSFTFTSGVRAVVNMRFDSPVTVGAGTTNLTIDVDVSSWFKHASGAIIDPTNSENQRAIERNIRASLRAFRDDNHDGDDDHGEEGGH